MFYVHPDIARESRQVPVMGLVINKVFSWFSLHFLRFTSNSSSQALEILMIILLTLSPGTIMPQDYHLLDWAAVIKLTFDEVPSMIIKS